MALLERVDEGLERTSEFAERAESARVEAENRMARAADVVAAMAEQIDREHALVGQLVTEIRETRDLESGRQHATLNALKRLEQTSQQVVSQSQALYDAIERQMSDRQPAIDAETRSHLRSMDKQLRLLADDMAVGRHESTSAVRSELRALINLIDARTRETGEQ